MPLRWKLALVAALVPAGFCGWLALRDSALFSVDRVTIEGLSAQAVPAVTEQLVSTARAQTTTDFSLAAVRASVAQYTLIANVRAQTHFPHGVTLIVTERRPVARLQAAGQSIPIARDGTVVSGLAHLPALAAVPSAHVPLAGHARDPFVKIALAVLAAAPAPLRERVVAVTQGSGALTIHLHRGPRLIFGNAALPHAKWDAAAAVLANRGSRGASYIDLRLPSRPVAQTGDPATTPASLASAGSSSAASGATVATVHDPALLGPSSST